MICPTPDCGATATSVTGYCRKHRGQSPLRRAQEAELRARKSDERRAYDAARNLTPERKAAKKASDTKRWADPTTRATQTARNVAWAAAHRSEMNGYIADWKSKNRDKVIDQEAAYRARKLEAFVENVSRAAVWLRDLGLCHICMRPAERSNWHLDHVVPLAKGGEHSYANVRVSHPSCNLRKGTKLITQ